jgi:signal transduction histidine kinase
MLVREPFTPALAERAVARLAASAVGAGEVALVRRVVSAAGVDELVLDESGGDPSSVVAGEPAIRRLVERLAAGEAVALSPGEAAAVEPLFPAARGGGLLLAPVRAAGALWGALGLRGPRAERPASAAERESLGFVAALLGAAIERAEVERERRASAERARQAERMEALGWLAAGLARDFDEAMTTIRGYGERVLDRLRSGDPLRGDVSEILLAAERAAETTRELASLGRRQPARPVRFELPDWLAGRLPLLRRLVGDEIVVSVHTSSLDGEVEADPNLLEQALVAFVLYARERLTSGGRVALACEQLTAGHLRERELVGTLGERVARIVVHDDGPPFGDDTASRLFEPYAGGRRGSREGMGLAAAYGIVRQCGGIALVAGSGAEGTTYEILLPIVGATAGSAAVDAAPSAASAGPAQVLLVEDEDLIRDLAEQILADAGYRVLAAANASEAMALAEQAAGPIDLLLTDVVMPGISGADLAHRLARRHPEMRILYMSGYGDSLIFRFGVLQERAAFLRKPFSAEILEQRVAELLGRGALPPASARPSGG